MSAYQQFSEFLVKKKNYSHSKLKKNLKITNETSMGDVTLVNTLNKLTYFI